MHVAIVLLTIFHFIYVDACVPDRRGGTLIQKADKSETLKYDPEKQKAEGSTIFPPDCEYKVPPECEQHRSRSWKAGVTEGNTNESPLTDTFFIVCHEAVTQSGYVPLDRTTGEVAGKSGVTIGTGIDLGSKDRKYFESIETPEKIINKLEPYFGLQRGEAAEMIAKKPLHLTLSDVELLNKKVLDHTAKTVQQQYNKDSRHCAKCKKFEDLHIAIRTAIVDVSYQFGHPSKYPKFWKFVTTYDWKNAVRELRDFYKGKKNNHDLKRRNHEANLIEAGLRDGDSRATSSNDADTNKGATPSHTEL